MTRIERVSGFFRVKAQVVESEKTKGYVFPEILKKVQYGQLASKPDDPSEILIAATGTVEQLKHLAEQSGITPLNDAQAETLQVEWSSA